MSLEAEVRAKRITSTKWKKYPSDIIPAWIADMDLGIAPRIAEELQRIISKGDLGYPAPELEANLLEAFSDRYLEKFNTPLDPALALVGTDVVQSIVVSILAFTEPGDGVIVQTPIYPPFLAAVTQTGREIKRNPLQRSDNSWEIDFDELERLASEKRTKLLLLCNPHNPTGRVFSQVELVKIASICTTHSVTVVSDEIHCDIVFSPNYHIPLASISPEFASNVITMNSATKSYNIAGLRCSITHFGSDELKKRYEFHPPNVKGSVSNLAMLATTTAWLHCDDWLDNTLEVLHANRGTVTSFVRASDTGLSFSEPEGTYLGWLDFRSTKAGMDPASYLIEKARVALSPGSDFGDEGQGWARLNFATPAPILQEIIERIADSL